jgi:hypothetical protein
MSEARTTKFGFRALRLIAAVATALVCMAVERASAFSTLEDVTRLYRGDIEFDVLRDGRLVGRHDVTFSSDEDGLLWAVSNFNLKINFLGFFTYRFDYRSKSQWADGKLLRIDADTNDDGTRKIVSAQYRDGLLRIIPADGKPIDSEPLFPTDHWNAGVLGQTRVLNTISGKVAEVSIEPQEREIVVAEGRPTMARRYVYSGDLATTVWYDDSGRWLKMRFRGNDGSSIEYSCRRCGLTTDGAEDAN